MCAVLGRVLGRALWGGRGGCSLGLFRKPRLQLSRGGRCGSRANFGGKEGGQGGVLTLSMSARAAELGAGRRTGTTWENTSIFTRWQATHRPNEPVKAAAASQSRPPPKTPPGVPNPKPPAAAPCPRPSPEPQTAGCRPNPNPHHPNPNPKPPASRAPACPAGPARPAPRRSAPSLRTRRAAC